MLRSRAAAHEVGHSPHFRWRGGEVSRLEGFSDAVLGFALTLLVVSLDMPENFDELLQAMRGFPAFAVCFALLVQIWYRHYLFFRRYGLQDALTTTLNAVLLFVLLFYVYPLKFLFTLVLGAEAYAARIRPQQVSLLFTIYGAGMMAVFGVLALLHVHAYRRRDRLDLNEIEVLDTRLTIRHDVLYVLIGAISIIVANVVPGHYVGLAGWCYALIGVAEFVHNYRGGRQRERVIASMAGPPAAADPSETAGAAPAGATQT